MRNLDSYRTCSLTKKVLIETGYLNCISCWQFVYKFDLVSEKDLSVIDTARATVTVADSEVVEAVCLRASGMIVSRYKLTDQSQRKKYSNCGI
jgi:hypothetical protein